MDLPLKIADLPHPLAVAVKPWVIAVETATHGMGEEVRAVAASATIGLLRRAVLTSPLETAIEDARIATSVLASALDRTGPIPPDAQPDARAALDALIVQLRTATPNARAEGLGLGW